MSGDTSIGSLSDMEAEKRDREDFDYLVTEYGKHVWAGIKAQKAGEDGSGVKSYSPNLVHRALWALGWRIEKAHAEGTL